MEPTVNIRVKGSGGTHQVPLSEVKDYVSKLRQTYNPLIDRAKRVQAHFKARRGENGYQVGGEIGIRDILAQASQWLSDAAPSEEALVEFGQDITPIWGDLRALGRAMEMIETPIDPTQFIRNGEFDLQAYNKAHYDKGAELGLELTAGVPLLGAGAYGLKFLLKDGRLANVLADGSSMAENALLRTLDPFNLGTVSREIIAGPNARNADLGMLAKAQEMKAQGVPTDDIYSETKWWLDHPDGVPRFEIDDSWAMPISQKTMSWGERADWEAGNPTLLRRQKALAHPKLSAAYPDSKNIAVSMRQDWGDSGSYKSDMDWITVGGESNGAANRSTMLHELQHAIQSREGMARGGSPEMFKPHPVYTAEELKDAAIIDKMMRSRDLDQLQAWELYEARFGHPPHGAAFSALERVGRGRALDDARDLARLGEDPINSYRRLAGEADARLVQNRMNMSMDERLADPFYRNYDVPLEDQIVRFGDGPSLSLERNGEPLGNLGAFKSQSIGLPSGDKLPEEYFWFDLGKDKIEVVQNPSNAELARLSAEQRKKYRLTGDDPPLRFTEDEFGNRFYWPSHEAVHYQIEPMIKQRIGRDVNQNAQENARWAKRRAEKLGKMRK